jgi:hypothetical protein
MSLNADGSHNYMSTIKLDVSIEIPLVGIRDDFFDDVPPKWPRAFTNKFGVGFLNSRLYQGFKYPCPLPLSRKTRNFRKRHYHITFSRSCHNFNQFRKLQPL